MSEDETQKRWTPEVHAQGEKRFDLKSMHVSETKKWVQGRQSQTKLQVDRQRRDRRKSKRNDARTALG